MSTNGMMMKDYGNAELLRGALEIFMTTNSYRPVMYHAYDIGVTINTLEDFLGNKRKASRKTMMLVYQYLKRNNALPH